MSLNERVLVFGAGLLAQSVASFFPSATILTKEECDVTDRDAVIRAVRQHNPEIVLNAAGITKPLLCEEQHGLAWRVNVYGARNVAVAAREARARSVHVSSNWAADPSTEYGRTKLASEYVGFDLILRVCFYDESYWVLNFLSQGDPVYLADTDMFNPISLPSMLKVVEKMLSRRIDGIVNIGVVERLTHYEFGVALARMFDLPTDLIKPVSVVTTPYEYPYNTFIEPHPLSRIRLEEDLREFRDTLSWKYPGTEPVADSSEVSDMRGTDLRDTRSRSDADGGRVR